MKKNKKLLSQIDRASAVHTQYDSNQSKFSGEKGGIFHGDENPCDILGCGRYAAGRGCHVQGRSGPYAQAAAAASIKFTGDGGIILHMGRNICDTLGYGRYA